MSLLSIVSNDAHQTRLTTLYCHQRYLRFHMDVTIYLLASAVLTVEVSDRRTTFRPASVISPSLLIPFNSIISTMGPAPLRVPAHLNPNKTPKISGPSVDGTTKQPATKNPSGTRSPHELASFARLHNSFLVVDFGRGRDIT